ncbi:MAG TPA: glycosyltransferase [Candidatus Brocadiia bacterium]|nr:glycosyltransferase [Candidatus Brocadiia bacterium]
MAATTLAVLSVSAGAGHVRAAEALRVTAQQRFPGVRVEHLDLMELVPKLFRQLYAGSYNRLVASHPAVWGYIYDATDKPRQDNALNKFRRAIERLNTKKLKRALDGLAPDAVICTHFLPAELLSRRIRKGKFDRPVFVQVTDFDVHRFWVHDWMTGYFATCEEVAWRMRDRGVSQDHIRVTGIPIMPVFAQPPSREDCAREIGLDRNRRTVLLMGGGAGVGGLDTLARRILASCPGAQLIAAAGKNDALLASLREAALAFPGRLFPVGFTTTIERLMVCADLAVTKPGGLSTSELLALGVPMILISPIPGQEERNADYLLEAGAALKASDAAALEYRITNLLANPGRLAAMAQASARAGRPRAAEAAIQAVLDHLASARAAGSAAHG